LDAFESPLEAAPQAMELIQRAVIWDEHAIFGITPHAASTNFFMLFRNGH
jgi:hypothetical protein